MRTLATTPRSPRRAALWFLAATTALGGCHRTPPPGSDGGIGLDGGLPPGWGELYQAACDYYDRCEADLGPIYGSAQDCVDYFSSVFGCSGIAELFEALGYEIDPVALQACLAAFNALPCGTTTFPGAEVCQDVFVGKAGVQEGDPCPGAFACGPDLYCHLEATCSICRGYAVLGEDCSERLCADDFWCDAATDTCAARQPDASPCAGADECASGACSACEITRTGVLTTTSCSGTGTCYAPAAEGAPCSPSAQCAGFRVCVAGQCADRLADGAACANDVECLADSWCDGAVCSPLPLCMPQPVGERCGVFLAECAATAYCDNSVDPPVCVPVIALGSPCMGFVECGPDAECGGGTPIPVCVALVPVGGACGAPDEPCADDSFCSAADMTCTALLAAGAPCTGDTECESDYCDATATTCGTLPACAM